MEKRVRFETPEGGMADKDDEQQPTKMKKHSLDSDEEEDGDAEENQNVMAEEEFFGVESGSVKYDGDIQITPFNLEEELETGHFDKAGNYIFEKESGDDKDNWLDDIDWQKVKEKESQQAGSSGNGKKDNDHDDDDDGDDALPEKETNMEMTYRQLVELLLPGETVQKAMQRLGKNCPKIQRGNNKRKQQQNNDANDPTKLKAKEDLNKLTSLADVVIQNGDMDFLYRTYEQLNLELAKMVKLNAKEVAVEDDMFGDGFDVNT